jgi:hypothetical protein
MRTPSTSANEIPRIKPLAPGWRDDGYTRERGLHGNLPKHYVEGPQTTLHRMIASCTNVRKARFPPG